MNVTVRLKKISPAPSRGIRYGDVTHPCLAFLLPGRRSCVCHRYFDADVRAVLAAECCASLYAARGTAAEMVAFHSRRVSGACCGGAGRRHAGFAIDRGLRLNVALALLNAAGLRYFISGPVWLGSLRNVTIYVLIAVLFAPGLVALAAGLEPTFGDGQLGRYQIYWWRWYLSNALGSLTLTPVFLAWPGP